MGKLFLRLGMISGLVLSLAALAVSCNEPESGTTKFTITEEYVDSPGEGGALWVNYTVDNPVEGMEIIPECDVDWITDFAVTEKQITFVVGANPDEQPREAEVKVTYGNLSDVFTVRQAVAEVIPITFDVKVYDIMATQVTYDVIPSDLDVTYLCTVVGKSWMDSFKDDESYYQDDIEYLVELADTYGMSIEDLLSQLVRKGEWKGIVYEGTVPETAYYAYAYGITLKGERTSDIFKVEFVTPPVEMKDIEFDITCEITNVADVSMTVVPSADDKYYMGAVSVADLDGKTPADYIQDDIDYNIYIGNMFGLSVSEILSEMLVSGEQTIDLKLIGSTDYIGFAVAVQEGGLLCSEVETKEFSTEEVLPSDNVITFDITSIEAGAAVFDVNTTNEDPYVFVVTAKESWAGYNDEQILTDLLTGGYDFSNSILQGDQTGIRVKGMSPLTDYYVMAFGYVAGVATTDLFKEEFRTIEGGDPSSLVFTFNVSDITSTSATVTVTGDPGDAAYYFDVIDPDYTSEEIIQSFEDDIAFFLDNGYLSSAIEYWEGALSRGEDTWNYGDLEPGTSYRPFAFGVYDTTGEIATDAALGEVFTTLSGSSSSKDIERTINKSRKYGSVIAGKSISLRMNLTEKLEKSGNTEKTGYESSRQTKMISVKYQL